MRQRARRYICLYCQKHKKQSVLLSEAHLHPGIAEAGRRADVHRRGPPVEDAQNYYKQVAADYQSELETLEKLSASPNIGCYRSYQIEPKEDGVGFEIYLLAEYRQTLSEVLPKRP